MFEDAKRFCIPIKLLREVAVQLDEAARAPEDHYLVVQVDYNEPHTSAYYSVYIVESIKVFAGPITGRGEIDAS
jgi:hypothetical protein